VLRLERLGVAFVFVSLLSAPTARADEPTSPPPADTSKTEPTEPPKPAEPSKPAETPSAEKPAEAEAKPATGGASKEAPKSTTPPSTEHKGTFQFGTYGRVIAAMDGKAGPGRDADVVAHGSRLDEDNYVEAELRREDFWDVTQSATRAVITLAIASPLFHWDANFQIKMAVRNLYLEEADLGLKGLSVWAGSRMLRGDDIYVLDYWPLDNLNTLGGGVGYQRVIGWGALNTMLHVGVSRPDAPFYHQSVVEQAPLDQFGTVPVELLNRQRVIGSLRAEWNQRLSDPTKGPGAGIKGVAYGELHTLPSGQRQEKPGVLEKLPADGGYVIGAELAAYTGFRDTYVNAFVRYATGIAAYGQWASPGELAPNHTTDGAHEVVVALGANAEYGPVGIMLGAYLRSFRDASTRLDYQDVDEGIVVARPTIFFGEIGGLQLEGSYQLAQRGVIAPSATDPTAAPQGPLLASIGRFGVVPYLSPAGRGDFSRPVIRFIYVLTARDHNARMLYPADDIFHRRSIEHFIGIGTEWWFNSSTYGGGK
jgi:hypothetical protein